jgi:hypothetical protein
MRSTRNQARIAKLSNFWTSGHMWYVPAGKPYYEVKYFYCKMFALL